MFESTAWIIYAYIVVGNVLEGTFIITFLGTLILGFGALIFGVHGEEEVSNYCVRWLKPFAGVFVVALLFGAAYPDKDDIKLILGGATVLGVGNAAINIEGANELPKNLVDAANTFLESIKEGTTSE